MDRFSIVEGYYWWLAEHHAGQSSREYQRLSRISRYFKPGILSHGPEKGSDAEHVYLTLCGKAGCEHEPR